MVGATPVVDDEPVSEAVERAAAAARCARVARHRDALGLHSCFRVERQQADRQRVTWARAGAHNVSPRGESSDRRRRRVPISKYQQCVPTRTTYRRRQLYDTGSCFRSHPSRRVSAPASLMARVHRSASASSDAPRRMVRFERRARTLNTTAGTRVGTLAPDAASNATLRSRGRSSPCTVVTRHPATSIEPARTTTTTSSAAERTRGTHSDIGPLRCGSCNASVMSRMTANFWRHASSRGSRYVSHPSWPGDRGPPPASFPDDRRRARNARARSNQVALVGWATAAAARNTSSEARWPPISHVCQQRGRPGAYLAKQVGGGVPPLAFRQDVGRQAGVLGDAGLCH